MSGCGVDVGRAGHTVAISHFRPPFCRQSA
jgi:hypothetical protein